MAGIPRTMQANLPDDPLVRETMASLGPGAKDSTLDDLAAWIRQLEELCDSKDPALAPASFRTDINGSCLSKFPASGTSAEGTKLQTKAVKSYPLLPELHMEKVSSKKKNARGEAKLRLSVERGPVLVLLTITDLHGASRTLLAVTADDNGLITIKHPATTIEVTAVPFAPGQILERLRIVEAKVKRQREHHARTSASPQPVVEEVSAQRQADGTEYVKKKRGSSVIEHIVDRETGAVTINSSGAPNLHGPAASVSLTFKNGQTEIDADDPQMNAVLAPVLKSAMENPHLTSELLRRKEAILKEEKEIQQKLPTAKPAEKQRLLKELEYNNAEYANLRDLMSRAVGGGWKRVTEEHLNALIEKATRKDPRRTEALAFRAQAAIDEYNVLVDKWHEPTSNESKQKRLSPLLGRKEIELDEALNEIAAIARGGWIAFPEAARFAMFEKAKQKYPKSAEALASRAQAALAEYNKLKEELESTSNESKKKRLSTLMGRKEIEFDAAMNEIAAIAAGGWLGVPKEELADRWVYARQKASVLAYRALDALTEYNKLKEKLESTADSTKKKRLATLLERKATEFDEAMSEVVVTAGGSEQGSSTQQNDVSARMNEALVLGKSP